MNAQQEVIAFLACPQSYDAPGDEVELIETHGSLIFLHGQRAYKLKRAIAYAALDFLSLDSRERACQAELRLNRRTAPDLYLEVRSINRAADGSLSFNGGGQVLDWVVVMRRFAQDALFERMALDGRLSLDLMDRLGAQIARFHASAELTPAFGGAAGIRQAIEDNHHELRLYLAQLDAVAVDALHHDSRAALEQLAGLLEQRRREGRVRRCHGDLRLANICLYEGRPTLFDGIEFSEQIACIDVLYDLAFVLMDLRQHGLPGHADRLLQRYLEHSALAEDCRPLPLFLSLRAATRCFTLASGALRLSEPQARAEKTAQAQALLNQANVYLHGDGQALTPRG
ncbi:phosphotransferase [Pseudomonas sp. SA3-5]|uniref:Phosphotransferase n=1 Tax=Pseudomonas aestuarii TaxID=3018340 RepID=A0ABT4XDR9_9PSED|nr:phosphotransferase [Pseudomonas aestuarii]MDA7086354.1 phosphotransferase [Pseudomonas aestuarii]